jgi:hypothetical protein
MDHKAIPYNHLRTLNALHKCRTEYMGGRVEKCIECGKEQTVYNSCRNRHCPKCGSIEREKWLIAREADLLPVNYMHVVFTLPGKLNHLFLHHQEDCYNILFRVVNNVMKGFAANPDFLDARIGYMAILHTWGQNLQYHPHLHLIVPAGGITRNNKWKNSKADGTFLFPVDQLSSVFRAQMVDALRQYVGLNKIPVKPKLFNSLFDNEWVVYAKPPFGGPKQVLSYPGRYTHRVAISNNRILKVDNQQVTFSWRDYNQDYKTIITALDGIHFLQRFCLHILPRGYTRIRHYGFLSSASKSKSLALIREYFGVIKPKKQNPTWQQIASIRMGILPQRCKICGAKMLDICTIPRQFHYRIRAPSIAA